MIFESDINELLRNELKSNDGILLQERLLNQIFFICMKNDTLFPVNMGTNPDIIINIALSFFRRSLVAGIRDKRNSRQMIYNEVEHIKKEYLNKDSNDSLIKKYLDEFDENEDVNVV